MLRPGSGVRGSGSRCCALSLLLLALAPGAEVVTTPDPGPRTPDLASVAVGPNPTAVRFFETKIRPVFVEHCAACHLNGKRHGGLKLDTLEDLLAGGHEGVVVEPGDPSKGSLLPALRWQGDSDLNMPPKYQLPEQVAQDVEAWIRMGAPWPSAVPSVVAAAPPERPPFFGRLHPLVVHLPITALGLALITELVALRRRSWSLVTDVLLSFGAFGALAAAATGTALEGVQDPVLLARHELLGWVVTALGLTAAGLALASHRTPRLRRLLWIALPLVAAGVILTGHYGGEMVHGRGWLTP